MSRRLDPPHDRVPLTREELRTMASLERAFAEDEDTGLRTTSADPSVGRLWARLRLRKTHAVFRLVRLAPWLALLGVLTLPLVISRSTSAGALWILFCGAAVTVWCVSRWGRWRTRLAAWGRRRAERSR